MSPPLPSLGRGRGLSKTLDIRPPRSPNLPDLFAFVCSGFSPPSHKSTSPPQPGQLSSALPGALSPPQLDQRVFQLQLPCSFFSLPRDGPLQVCSTLVPALTFPGPTGPRLPFITAALRSEPSVVSLAVSKRRLPRWFPSLCGFSWSFFSRDPPPKFLKSSAYL